MEKGSAVTRMNLAAALSPLLLLLATPLVVIGIYTLGGSIEALRGSVLLAMDSARGMDLSLYQMEWGLTRSAGEEIVNDQRRQFGNWAEIAQEHVATDEQRRILTEIGQQAEPIFSALREAAQQHQPLDDATDRRMRELHGLVNELASSDQAVIMAQSARGRRQATNVIAIALVAMVLVPWLCLGVVWSLSSRLRQALKTIRRTIEDRAAPGVISAVDSTRVKIIDENLTALGFLPRDPALED